MAPELPIPDCYWVEPGRLLAGEFPAGHGLSPDRRRLEGFLRAGIDTFIDLTSVDEMPSYQGLLVELGGLYGIETRYHQFPVGDYGLPSAEQMKTTLDTIDAALAEGRCVYVHCWGGIGRTGTVVGCWLVRKGMTGEQALAQLADWWQAVPKSRWHPRSPETERQVAFVRDWRE